VPPDKPALNEVLNVTLIKETPGSEVVDEDLDDGDEGIASPKPPPSATASVQIPI